MNMIVTRQIAVSNCKDKDKWETPPELFEILNEKYSFTLDPCCEPETAKCKNFYTPIENGLDQNWSGEIVFCNPPYSRGNIDQWMKKCYQEAQKGVKIVALVPVSSSSNWWHEYVWQKAKIVFIKGRLKFVGAPYTAPFSSCLILYNLDNNGLDKRITLSPRR